MKRSGTFMIKCFMENASEELINNLQINLDKFIQNIFKDVNISLRSNENYWKYPKDKQIIFEVKSHNSLNIAIFVAHMAISWEYNSEIARDADTDKLYFSEEALWNKIEDSDELFFLPEVHWVRVYTWPEDEIDK